MKNLRDVFTHMKSPFSTTPLDKLKLGICPSCGIFLLEDYSCRSCLKNYEEEIGNEH